MWRTAVACASKVKLEDDFNYWSNGQCLLSCWMILLAYQINTVSEWGTPKPSLVAHHAICSVLPRFLLWLLPDGRCTMKKQGWSKSHNLHIGDDLANKNPHNTNNRQKTWAVTRCHSGVTINESPPGKCDSGHRMEVFKSKVPRKKCITCTLTYIGIDAYVSTYI